jgi:hypothetical protein
LSFPPARAAVGATSPLATVAVKDRNPPYLVVREGDHGCRLRGQAV